MHLDLDGDGTVSAQDLRLDMWETSAKERRGRKQAA